MVIKEKIKEWAQKTWDAYETEELENQALEQINTYSQKVKETAWKPVDYYREQESFYRGLFWIALGLLIILWIISGS